MDRTIRIDLRRYRAGPGGHRHDHHQVVVALEGEMTLDLDGCARLVTRDVAAFVPGGAMHAFEACRDSRFLVMDVADAGARASARPGDPWHATGSHPFVDIAADVRDYLDFLGTRVANGALPDALAEPAGRLAIELLGAAPETARPSRGPIPESVVRACRPMAARLDRTTTVADIAAPCGKSPSRLHALFREHLDTTPRRWLLERRLDEASRLLAGTRWPVERIASAIGFADASAFGRAFRRSRSVTPLGYRSRSRSDRRAAPGNGPEVDESGQGSRKP